MEPDKGKEKEKDKEKALAQALFDLFTNVSSFVQGELQVLAKFTSSWHKTDPQVLHGTHPDLDPHLGWTKAGHRGTNNLLELLEKMNLRTADEYNNFGDIASGLRVFVEQLKTKNENFHEYMQQIDEIDQQVTELEAVVSTLDKYTYTLENKVRSAYVESRPK
ncbi:hypothetical protein SUGI_0287310 [Cryptomeria japonica]|uniref:biogenesis of lysosome-related organelles complex 1 subunit 2 isoform X1 n=1 Tax=Cryptomeria japonica TaxID=3369 RepID=UPI002408E72C|nr:biogenesis of lysosome-related organelles complex 1 subunit 2 isoform X1 [Cryptomeria japonica]GLJ16720.1 hypothetical protein SUGI_0287310 [Cryptomeria japonica]